MSTTSSTTQTSAPALAPMLRKLEYRTPLGDADRTAILALPHSVRNLEPHQFIIRERDVATHACVMLSGFAIRHKIVAGGHRQILAIQMRGDMENALLGIADHSVQMLTRGEIAMIPRDEIVRAAFDHPDIGRAMWFDTMVDASVAREWIANVGRRDARTRIAHILCEFSLRLKMAGLGGETGYELPMTQEQIADSTGLTPVHVNRTLKALEDADLITRTSARVIRIGDWRRLAEAGDFDSTYLHLHPDAPAVA